MARYATGGAGGYGLKHKLVPVDALPTMEVVRMPMIEYAVLDFAVGAPDFEKDLNKKAAEGWRLVAVTRSEKRVLMFMERPVQWSAMQNHSTPSQ